MLNAVEHAAELPREHRAALADVVRIEVKTPGWLFESAVAPGKYTLGLRWIRNAPHFVLRDDGGKELSSDVIRIVSPTMLTSKLTASSGKASMLELSAGNIVYRWRFIAKRKHDALAAGFDETRGKSIRVFADFDDPGVLEKLVRDLDAAAEVHAELLGAKSVEGPFSLYLTGKHAVYKAFDELTTGGTFRDAGAFTSEMTRKAYVWCAAGDPRALSDFGLPLKSRALAIHELGHMVAGGIHEDALGGWPSWLSEGLAELGTSLALHAVSRADGKAFHEQLTGVYHFGRVSGANPGFDDLFAGRMDTDRGAWYATAYLLVRELAGKRRKLSELIDVVAAESLSDRMNLRAAELCRSLYGGLPRAVSSLSRRVSASRAPPAVVFGCLDREKDGWRLTPMPGGQARVVFADEAPRKDGVAVTTELAFHASGQQQADVYLAHRNGRHAATFLKLAILPQRMRLFWFRSGEWYDEGTVDYDQALAVGSAAKPSWHSLEVVLESNERRLRAKIGGRDAKFELPGFVSTEDTRVGLGSYNGIVRFRNLKVR
jgi:hypothetical protein